MADPQDDLSQPDARRCVDSVTADRAISLHDYLSTACYHGQHDQCRKQCKFCEVGCNCGCHNEAAMNRRQDG